MEVEKRKKYALFTSVFGTVGFLIYGGMAAANRELLHIPWNILPTILIYGLGGSLLLGGLALGIMFFADFFQNRKSVTKILLCIFFPVTFMFICLIGILSLIPYGIYNLVMIKKAGRDSEI